MMVVFPPHLLTTIAAVLRAVKVSQLKGGVVSEASGSPESTRSSFPSSSSSPSPSNGSFATIQGPVIKRNFPDPSAIQVDGVWHAFATNNHDDPHVQVASSEDFVTWTYLKKDALPDAGPWSTNTGIWAPDVVQINDGTFVLYYSATVKSSPAQHCVGVATSSNIEGPYEPLDQPFACPLEIGGAIDADGFLDRFTGKRYVVYKVDGNSLGHGGACNNGVEPLVPTPIHLQEVGEDGMTAIGDPVEILDRTDDDGPLVEGPSMHVSEEGIYFLLFSSDCYTTPNYDVKYATASNITGPYTRAPKALLSTGDGPNLIAPGGPDVASDPAGYMVFHADIGSSGARNRQMYTARPKFEGTTVTI